LTTGCVLPCPQGRKVTTAATLGLRAQRQDCRCREWERRRRVAERADLRHDSIDDAAGRAAGEDVSERGMPGGRRGERSAGHGRRGAFRTHTIRTPELNASTARGAGDVVAAGHSRYDVPT